LLRATVSERTAGIPLDSFGIAPNLGFQTHQPFPRFRASSFS
jgi:hypothetical protein